MKDFVQALQDAFPILRSHPVLMARLFLFMLLLAGLYVAKKPRARVCKLMVSRLVERIASTTRFLYVYRDSNVTNDWKYYTSEVVGKGQLGDDIIWTLVGWPSLRPKDSFRVAGAVGMVDGILESQAKLEGRWNIIHNPDLPPIGPVPARGVRSRLRRVAARLLHILGSI
jgi:hypothetical protein